MYRLILFSTILFISCNKREDVVIDTNNHQIRAVDISSFPEISIFNPIFYDLDGAESDLLTILSENGVNTIRLRLWRNPSDEHSGWNEVREFSKELKNRGFKTWISVHYSDTWADPGHQELPNQWSNLGFQTLKDSVYDYTERIISELKPDYIQIGNEINNGFLHPAGHFYNHFEQFSSLLDTAIWAVRTHSSQCKIVLHYAGIQGAEDFYNTIQNNDFDIIGLSYYPIWHGKNLNDLKSTLQRLGMVHNKTVVLAETAYPFTLMWNDWTTNIVGLEEQLILPNYPASAQGQKSFIHDIKTIVNDIEFGGGFCYWGAELVAWKGTESTSASSWENQALFDFNNKALPVLNEFKN